MIVDEHCHTFCFFALQPLQAPLMRVGMIYRMYVLYFSTVFDGQTAKARIDGSKRLGK